MKSNVRSLLPSDHEGPYALMTEVQFTRSFRMYEEADKVFAKLKAKEKVFLKKRHPVPADLVELIDEKRGIRDRLRNPLMVANMRLVFSICKRYIGRGTDYLDIVQDAVFGLDKALEGFDPDRGFSFSTYASWWIRSYASMAAQRQSSKRMMYVPPHHQVLEYYLKNELESFESAFGRTPTDDELRGFTSRPNIKELSQNKLRLLRMSPSTGVSIPIDAPTSEEDPRSLANKLRGSTPSPEALVFAREQLAVLKEEVRKVFTSTNVHRPMALRDDAIVRMRYGLDGGTTPKTLNEVGLAFRITRERVRQIVDRRLEQHHLSKRAFQAKLEDMLILVEALSNLD